MKLKILHKLFLVIVLSCGLTGAALLLWVDWSLNRGFLAYVNQVEASQLDEIVGPMEAEYLREDGWEPLKRSEWQWPLRLGIVNPPSNQNRPSVAPTDDRNATESSQTEAEAQDPDFSPPPRRDEQNRPPPRREDQGWPPPRRNPNGRPPPGQNRPPPPPPRNQNAPPPRSEDDPLHIFGRVVLLDQLGEPVIGRPNRDLDLAKMRKLYANGVFIGQVGLIPLRELSQNRELAFLRAQTHTYLLFAMLLLLLTAIVAALLARHFSRPIKALAVSARKVSGGDYSVKTRVKGSDEVAELTIDFNNLVLTLGENERARRHWVADISHELRTPLTVLRGEIEAIQDGIRLPDPETLETLHAEVLCLSQLVNDLYELSLSDLGALSYRKEPMNLAQQLEQVVHGFENRFADKGLELQFRMEKESDFEILGDKSRLFQLFSNLLENSARYTDVGGIVSVEISRSKNKLQVTIEDSEPGVPEAAREHLFERLFRVESSRNRKTGGAGLGLSICRNIVEAHEGTIDAEASALGGLKMKILFPMQDS